MKRAIFTIVAKNYLAHARSLMESVAQTTPDVERFVVLVDEPEDCFDPSLEPFTILSSRDLPIPDSRWFHFKYTIIELSTAVKPYAAQVLLEEHNVDRLIYFDPDIILYQSSEVIFSELDDADILLTPHLTSPIDDKYWPDELDILRSGTYNLGFIGMRRSASVSAMLDWWQSRLYDLCVVSVEQGLFVDQRWMDLAPGLFSGVKVVRDPGWNVAYWNVCAREVGLVDGAPTAAGRPLVFFHFSGFDPLSPETFSRHQNRLVTRDLGDAAALVEGYKDRLLSHGFGQCRSWACKWSRFDDGSPIPDVARPVHHEEPEIINAVEDPFSETGRKAIAAAWNRPALDSEGRATPFSRLALRIYSARADLQDAMPDVFGADEQRFCEWFLSSGQHEHNIPSFLVDPMRLLFERRKEASDIKGADRPAEGAQAKTGSGDWLDAMLSTGISMRRHLSARYRTFQFHSPEVLADIERYVVEPLPSDGWIVPPPRIAQMILADRPDVRVRCESEERLDEGWYLAWLLTYGRREYGLPSVVTDALDQYWNSFLRESSLASGLRARLYRLALGVRSRRHASSAGVTRLRAGPSSSSAARVSKGHPAAHRPPSPGASATGTAAAARNEREFGVNLIGYTRAQMGVGESVRLARRALEASGVAVALRGVSTNGHYAEHDTDIEESDVLPYIFDVVHANADSFGAVVADALGPLHNPEFTVGYWAWELEEFPEHFDAAFAYCSEIWTPSVFCRRAIETRSPLPVVVIPHPVYRQFELGGGLADFSLNPDRFVFLCMADMLSIPARKNPLGVIKAFLRAAPRMPGSDLIVKISNSGHDPAALAEIRAAAATGPVRVLDQVLSRAEADSLLNCADCFVSLHRSEGFGLPMAEAMALGKAVIATAYSGNMDYMNEECAFLVDYKLGSVPKGCAPYRPGASWAEPSVDHAAEQMAAVYSNSALREKVAAAGQRRVRSELDPARVGELMLARLRVMERRWKGG